jgi:undecaprenyl-diphosphatase
MTAAQAILLGIVQGVSEFLPISSSGHLVIVQKLLNITQSQITFDVFLHVASLLAIIIFFYKKLKSLTKKEILLIGLGTLPAAIVGFLFKNNLETIFTSTKIVGGALMITGLINLISDQLISTKNKKALTWQASLKIGFFQALAIIPGLSRSGITLVGGSINKLGRQKSFEFAFFLAIPAILGAGALHTIDLYQTGFESINLLNYILGGLAALGSGLLSLKFLNYVLKKAKLEWFGWYCLIMGLVTLIFI